jgi:outer membrane protein assembly factor BamA
MKLNNYRCKNVFVTLFLIINSQLVISGQSDKPLAKDSTGAEQKDIIDVFHRIFPKKLPDDTVKLKSRNPSVSVIPSIGYSIHTGFMGDLEISTTFYSDYDRRRNSNILVDAFYSQFSQYWFTANSKIFLEKHNLQLLGDTRYYRFPTQTYGLGTQSLINDPIQIDYSYLRLYQIVLREIGSNFFFGVGYNLDYHWNVKADTIKSQGMDQFVKYQEGTHSVSSGISVNLIYDDRKNVINPRNGTYVRIQFRPNMTWLGSDSNWQSLLVDIRHYIKLPASSRNILALWSYNDITLSGTPPYLDMPSTGWDDNSGTGRGYIPGRYTGPSLVYFEAEYRFSLTRNGLLGGVIFGNLETVSELVPDDIKTIIPAGGLGLRIKLNKYSDTNLTVDYGFGVNGSHGIYFSMGEVF